MTTFHPQPKPEPRKRTKARRKRQTADRVTATREYVFARERNHCRCCRIREAHSMHELLPKSCGGKVSRQNSVAVCGSGTTLCHGLLQQHQVLYEFEDVARGAEGTIVFRPRTLLAANYMRIALGETLVSPPMVETEIA